MNTVSYLMDAVKDIWEQYNEHPFVKGIENQTLDREKFRYYIIQDCLYLEEYAKVFALGTAKAKSMKTARLFAKYIPVMNGELDVHEGYLARLKITQKEIDSAQRALDNLSYTSYMLRVAYEESEAEILAAILACAWSYEIIAKKIAANNPSSVCEGFYSDWIQGYISESYSRDNQILLDTLNELTVHYTQKQIQHLAEIFTACSRYELAFWQMAWTMSS